MLDPAVRQTATVGGMRPKDRKSPWMGLKIRLGAKMSMKGSCGGGVPLPHFFEGLAAEIVKDLPKPSTQRILSLEIFHPWKISFQREFAFTYTHLVASRLPL